MKKGLKYTLVSLGGIIVVAGIVLAILYVCRPNMVRSWFWRSYHVATVYVDRLKGKPYTKGGYNGIDVSKHNGIIKWKKVAKNERIKYVFVRATEGKGYVDPLYRRNLKEAKKMGLLVGSYHLFTSKTSATAQFLHFKSIVQKSEQDLIPVLDVEEKGIKGRWKGQQLVDSVKVFAELVKKHYGKYPIIYSNEDFYNKDMDAQFGRYLLFIANYNRPPALAGSGKCNLWQYSEHGHLHGIGEYVDLSRFMNGTTIKDLMLHCGY